MEQMAQLFFVQFQFGKFELANLRNIFAPNRSKDIPFSLRSCEIFPENKSQRRFMTKSFGSVIS
jgi:hypothetical protein